MGSLNHQNHLACKDISMSVRQNVGYLTDICNACKARFLQVLKPYSMYRVHNKSLTNIERKDHKIHPCAFGEEKVAMVILYNHLFIRAMCLNDRFEVFHQWNPIVFTFFRFWPVESLGTATVMTLAGQPWPIKIPGEMTWEINHGSNMY